MTGRWFLIHKLSHSNMGCNPFLPPRKQSLRRLWLSKVICLSTGGSLSREVSVQGGLCPRGSLSKGVSVWGASVQAVSVRETIHTVMCWCNASYWNAFLLSHSLVLIRAVLLESSQHWCSNDAQFKWALSVQLYTWRTGNFLQPPWPQEQNTKS